MSGSLALITGYPGWLAGRLLEALRQEPACNWQETLRGYRWRVLVAPGVRVDDLPAPIAEVHSGDVRDPEAARAAVQGADLVLHAAGLIHPHRIRQLYSVNAGGTACLARQAVAAGVRRFVLISSNAAAGFAASATAPLCEADPPRPQSPYGRSKRQAEEALEGAVAASATEAVVLRPTTFYGPHFPRRHLRAYAMARGGRPLLIGRGDNTVSMVYIDNLVQGVGLALTRPRAAGRTYFLADAPVYRFGEVLAEMGRAQGVEARFFHLPESAARLCHLADRALSALGLYALPLHVAGEATRHMGCSIDRAREELGYRPRVELPEGLRRAVDWAREAGWL